MTYALHLGDCLEFMKSMPDKSVDAAVTDPPYGCKKAAWDYEFPVEWFIDAKRISLMQVTITGSRGTKDSIKMVGDDFIDVIAAWNLNSLTRGPLGFNNWLAAVVSGEKLCKSNIPNFFEFAVRGEMPNHPSPKPIEYMRKLISRVTRKGDTIFDPFMGSGTTGVAAIQLGRNFIGCEIDPDYFAIAEKRIKEATLQPQLFKQETPKATQENFLDNY